MLQHQQHAHGQLAMGVQLATQSGTGQLLKLCSVECTAIHRGISAFWHRYKETYRLQERISEVLRDAV